MTRPRVKVNAGSMTGLPIEDVLGDLIEAMAGGLAVLQAPPGAGKTTRVPLALLQAGAFEGRLVMLEPRRLAARAAAERMAQMLGESVGQTVGYRMRGATKISDATRIEVVTDGILTRMIQSQPDLAGVGLIVFDEFHERSLNADLGLALASDIRGALRDDLKLLVMSATLDAQPVADLLGAPILTSEGQSFPVTTKWLPRPLSPNAQFEATVADLVQDAATNETGSILVFLPGEAEIRRVMARLDLPDIDIRPLYGALPFSDQRAAIAPSDKRKIVLATSIAETSLTIEDIRIVIDAGRARRAQFDQRSGMSRLVTVPVSRAEADQRRGRAGRVGPGTCYRMWSKPEGGALPSFPPAEIEAADLTGLALDLANWGATPGDLAFLTPPPEGAFRQARELLNLLGALKTERITEHGRAMAATPAHPRLAHMMGQSDVRAAEIAALLGERDPLPRGAGADFSKRLKALEAPGPDANRAVIARARQDAKRLRRFCSGPKRSVGEMLALAYPDRIGLRRPGQDPRYILSGGKGAVLPAEDNLANARMIVALDLDGSGREATCRLAAPLTEAELRDIHGDAFVFRTTCVWSKRHRRVEARQQECFGALILKDTIWNDAPEEQIATALLQGVRDLGLNTLNWSKSATLLRARVIAAYDPGLELPDWSDAALLDRLEDWLLPYLSGLRDIGDLKKLDPHSALQADLGWDVSQKLDQLAPAQITTPLGRQIAVDYSGETPAIAVRLQEMLGATTHPTIGPAKTPIQITLLSPAQRPIQITTDLPGFWDGSYADVRKDMRARYPRHNWPEDPRAADPTLRAKPRKR